MCDNTNIHERVQASIATATREVDTALESVRAMRRAILAQVAEATSKVDFDRDIYLKDGEYIELLKCKDQVDALLDLVTRLEADPTGDAPVMSYKTAAYRIRLALDSAL